MDICARLRRNMIVERNKRGLSQEDLAAKADIHRTYLSGLERGIRNPTLKVLERLAEALETTPSRLLE